MRYCLALLLISTLTNCTLPTYLSRADLGREDTKWHKDLGTLKYKDKEYDLERKGRGVALKFSDEITEKSVHIHDEGIGYYAEDDRHKKFIKLRTKGVFVGYTFKF